MQAIEIHTHTRAETQAVGRLIGVLAQDGLVIALNGDLGAGKTTFVQGLAAGMGIRARVTSPTFVLVNEYDAENGRRLIHVDTYRLAQDAAVVEASTFGLGDLLDPDDLEGSSVIAIEWADRVQSLLPDDVLRIEIADASDQSEDRTFHLSAVGQRSEAVLARLASRVQEIVKG